MNEILIPKSNFLTNSKLEIALVNKTLESMQRNRNNWSDKIPNYNWVADTLQISTTTLFNHMLCGKLRPFHLETADESVFGNIAGYLHSCFPKIHYANEDFLEYILNPEKVDSHSLNDLLHIIEKRLIEVGFAEKVLYEDFEELLTTQQAAIILGTSTKRVYGLLRTGKIPHFRFGRLYRIPLRGLTFYSLMAVRLDELICFFKSRGLA